MGDSSKPPGKPGDPPKPPKPAPAGEASAAADEGGPSTLALLFAPASVAVGLVFFAMGCMIGLTIEGRFIRFSVSVPAETPSAPVPPPSAGPTHTAGFSATAVAPPPPATSGAAPPAASSSKPATPPGTGRPQGSGKRPPIIFGGG